jgi:hypothetical protein
MSKAERFAEEAKQAGWSAVVQKDGPKEWVIASKDEARVILTAHWDCERFDYPSSSLMVDGAKRTIRNASACRRMLTEETIRPVVERKRSKKPKPITADPIDPKVDEADDEDEEPAPIPRPKHLPFKISSPSEEIRKAVIGKEITWWNQRTKMEDSARVLPDPNQRQLKIEYTRDRKRVLSFAAVGEGFRSIHIDAILSVK